MSTHTAQPATPEIDAPAFAHLLSNARRCHVIETLAEREAIRLPALAEVVARAECGPEYSRRHRKAVYVTLYQTHLEALLAADVCRWTLADGEKRLTAGPTHARYHDALRALRRYAGGEGQ